MWVSSGNQVNDTVGMFMPLNISPSSRRAVWQRLARFVVGLVKQIVPAARCPVNGLQVWRVGPAHLVWVSLVKPRNGQIWLWVNYLADAK